MYIVLLVVGCLVSLINAQECQPFSPSYAPISAKVCSPFLSPLIWVPIATPFAQYLIDQQLNTSILWNLTIIQSIAPTGCYSQIMSLACNSAFIPCNNVFVPQLNRTVPVPVPACKSVCESVNMKCKDFWTKVSAAPLDCNTSSPLIGANAWPVDHYETTVEGVVVQSKCFQYHELPRANIPWNSTCPYPLIKVDEPTESNPLCDLPCPDQMMDIDEWQTLGRLQVACASVSVCMLTFLCAYYIANPNCRKRKKIFELCGFLNMLMFEVSFLMGGRDPVNNIWCLSSTEFATYRRPSCAFQGVFFSYFSLSTSMWIAIYSVNLYLLITRTKHKVSRGYVFISGSFASGIPFILVVIPTARGMIKFYYHAGVCFIQGEIGDLDLSYHYFLFFMPLCIALFVTFAFTAATSVRLLAHRRSLSKIFNSNSRESGFSAGRDVRLLKYMNIRLVIWCALQSTILLATLVYRVQLGNKRPTQDWIKCKVMAELNLGSSAMCPEATVPTTVSYAGTLLHYAIVSSLGSLCFLIAGANKSIYIFWASVISPARRRDWQQLVNVLTMTTKQLQRVSLSLPSSAPTTPTLTTATVTSYPSSNSPQSSLASSPSELDLSIPIASSIVDPRRSLRSASRVHLAPHRSSSSS